ncbi:hypothetical protein [Thalassobellus suaedae]|uniref:Uncharacterized protein n=1 Tax=Thalassobellus suaedae TaxID=3074124 RepID=A0ABY9Y837_9FLAO|nr:hypothetical protein RHP49_08200 [Flavobacteriaceae bacterium HL-DH10]
MNIKFLATLSLFVIFFCCKQKQETNLPDNKDENISQDISEKDLSKLNYIEFTLDEKTAKAIADWNEYNELQTIATNVKKGDLSYFDNDEDPIKVLIKNSKQTIPNAVNTEPTLARITALETKLYKLENLSNLSTTSKKELTESIREFLESFSNLNFQMNKKLEKDSQNIEKP